MTSSLQEKIVDALKVKPNQKAADLARALDVDKTDINKQLYGPLKDIVLQDRSYRWSVQEKSSRAASTSGNDEDGFSDTELAKLCRYYLSCLGYDDTGVSAFLTSKYGDPDYIEATALPQSADDLASSEAARKMLGRKRTEQGRYGLYFGYPTNIALIRSKKSSWEGFVVEPIFLFPIEQDNGGQLSVDLSYPIINHKPFQTFTNAERDMLMSELVQLEQELGIGGEEAGRVDIDELAMRLQSVRPEWPWREAIDPSSLNTKRIPIAEIDQPGIYNRAVIVMAEKSPFTQGLEKELRDLASLPKARYENTALGRWVHGFEASAEEETIFTQPLLEVLPMNTEQRQAVSAALTRPMTIITGPPGTGKSQVVTNLLINAAWTGKRVLFASKNNKAVDVVETRVNALGPRPILLRLGAQSYQIRLAEYVLSLMSSINSAAEKENFDHAKATHERLLEDYKRLLDETRRVIELRNNIDRLEQEAEDARNVLGATLFARSLELNLLDIRTKVNLLSLAINKAVKAQTNPVLRLFWPVLRKALFSRIASALQSAGPELLAIGLPLPSAPCKEECLVSIKDAAVEANQRLIFLKKAAAYLGELRFLQKNRSLEDIARDEKSVLERIAQQSQTLWKLWLRLQPSILSADDRKKLGKYVSILNMVIEAGDKGQLTKQVYIKYNQMLQEVSHLMPCWAVTSLSARGRVPFEPCNFDLVIFDEASQCDIASALPLLYRAKSVVIIGDAKQLSHISGLQKGQDQALLEKYGLLDEFPHWSYSHQSLFGLGSTQVSGQGIVSLVDHHRSHSDIISFSNEEFYEQKLRVATRYDNLKSPNRAEPGIRWVDIKGKVSRPGNGGAVNPIEAKAVVSALRDLVIVKGYKGSIGVVTPFRAQANLITELINRDKDLESELVQQGFLTDTVHKFQGDERDIMLFSPVVSDEVPTGALGFLRSNGNLFNVAITRARAQLIVVGDLSACASCDIGYLSRFANYSADLEKRTQEINSQKIDEFGSTYPLVTRPELVSDWEREFYVAAYKAGIRLIPQYPVEKYIVDFVAFNGERKLAIEIDGERYHRNWTGELCRRDQIRNQRLMELGYDVMRFWVYEVRDDLTGCLNRIHSWQGI